MLKIFAPPTVLTPFYAPGLGCILLVSPPGDVQAKVHVKLSFPGDIEWKIPLGYKLHGLLPLCGIFYQAVYLTLLEAYHCVMKT